MQNRYSACQVNRESRSKKLPHKCHTNIKIIHDLKWQFITKSQKRSSYSICNTFQLQILQRAASLVMSCCWISNVQLTFQNLHYHPSIISSQERRGLLLPKQGTRMNRGKSQLSQQGSICLPLVSLSHTLVILFKIFTLSVKNTQWSSNTLSSICRHLACIFIFVNSTKYNCHETVCLYHR